MTGRTCDDYCAQGGLVCVEAWEEVNNDCKVKQDLRCDEVFPGTSDLLCKCSELVTTVAPSTTPPATTTLPLNIFPECTVLPDVKSLCSQSGCKVLAGGMTGRTCDDYCQSSGLTCIGAWEETQNNCDVKEIMQCSQTWPGTSDLICECALEAPTTPALPSTTPAPTECATLPEVKQICSANGCKVLAGGMTGRTCGQYCESHGLLCIGAWEERDNGCDVHEVMQCSQTWPGTSDLLCECAPHAPVTSTTSSPPLAGTKSYIRHEGANCWRNHGAEGIAGKDPVRDAVSLDTCKELCDAEDDCEGLVVFRGNEESGQCWLRKDVELSECEEGTVYDFYLRASGLPPATVPAVPAAGAGWDYYEGTNCCQGSGAEGIEGKDPVVGTVSLDHCQWDCEQDGECKGIVMVRGTESGGSCWLRTNVRLSECVEGTIYDLWLRRPAARILSQVVADFEISASPQREQQFPDVEGWGYRVVPMGMR